MIFVRRRRHVLCLLCLGLIAINLCFLWIAKSNSNVKNHIPTDCSVSAAFYKSIPAAPIHSQNSFAKLYAGLWIYSVYFDHRINGIRAIAIGLPLPIKLRCLFPTKVNSSLFWSAEATFYELPDRHHARMNSFLLTCDLPRHPNCLSERVMIASDGNVPLLTTKVKYDRRYADNELGLCWPPIYGTQYSARNYAVALEFARGLGVGHVDVYMHSSVSDQSVVELLKYYNRSGFVSLHNWTLPISPIELFYYGQIAAMHDCLYRNLHRLSLLFHDVDEHIETLHAKGTTAGEVLLRNLVRGSFAALMVTNDVSTKYVVVPARIVSLSVHAIDRALPSGLPVLEANYPPLLRLLQTGNCAAKSCEIPDNTIRKTAQRKANEILMLLDG